MEVFSSGPQAWSSRLGWAFVFALGLVHDGVGVAEEFVEGLVFPVSEVASP